MSSGLKSNVSTWLTAPEQKIMSTRFARAGKCVGRGAFGLAGLICGRIGTAAACARSRASRCASAMPPSPVAVCARKLRRLRKGCMALGRGKVQDHAHLIEVVRCDDPLIFGDAYTPSESQHARDLRIQ